MQAAAWIQLLRLVPETHQNNLLLGVANGSEIAIQAICRMDPDYLLVRGRLTGTTDGGGVFLVPFDQIIFLGFQRQVEPATLQAMFGSSFEPAPSVEVPAQETPQPQAVAELPPSTPPAPAPVVAIPSAPAPVAGKVDLLERWRSQRAKQTPS
jgi:hypothetical protein